MDRRVLFFGFIFLFVYGQSFNVDTDFPIILHDEFDGPDSHFGASLTLLESGWLMIGAPKANSSGINYTDVKEPGIVWRCRVGPEPKECQLVQMDPAGNLDVRVETVPFELVHRDRKDEGMMGASIASGDSDRFVSCASRWVNQKYAGHHLMNGICYWVAKDHLQSNFTNATWPWLSSGLTYRLIPLLSRSRQAYTVPTVPVLDPPERRFDWAFGQAGFSIHISKNNELILGAPGILEWTGSVIRFKDMSRRAFGNVVVARAQYQAAKNILQYFDYFGYSVTAGKFFREIAEDQIQYASGAPRAASLCGKVLVFTFNEGDTAESLNLLVDPIEGGNSFFGSYFGSTLAAVDTNGDGFDELLIGAPLYKSSHGNLRSIVENSGHTSESGDEGCVFIYISTGKDFRAVAQEICGDNRAGGRFGSAISILGDLNMDGYQDIAIGAPYENYGRGAVYIYYGSRNGLFMAQKLDPQEIEDSIRGFGYALSPGVDVDNNSYPDIAVGSISSNHAVIFRTIPVVNITGNLSASVSKLTTSTGKFEIVSCLAFGGLNVPNSLQIVIKLLLDTEVRKQRIAEFLPTSIKQNSSNLIVRTNLYKKSGTCYSFEASTVGDLDLVTLPLSVRQDFELLSQPKETIQAKPLSYEIQKIPRKRGSHLVQVGAKDADFDTKWPMQMSHVFGVSKLSLPIGAICEDDGDPICLAHLNLKSLIRTPDGDIYSEDIGSEFLIGSYRSISLEVEVMNFRETANLPLCITISWKSPPIVRSSRSDCSRQNGESGGDEQVYICNLRKPLTRNKKETVVLELDMSGIFADRNFLHFELTANTSSELIDEPMLIFSPPLKTKAELVIFGQLNDAPYYENMTAEAINFTHVFEIGMNGISPIASLKMEFLIPRDIEINGEMVELLKIREPISTYDGDKLRCIGINGMFYIDSTSSTLLENEISLDKISTDDKTNRQREQKLKRDKPNPTPRDEKPTHLVLNCSMSGIFCLKVHCEANRFRPTSRAILEFRLRLVTHTARLLFTEVEDREVVIIESDARVFAVNVDGVQFGIPAHAVSKTLLKVQPPQEIGAWIVILSFAGGLILLSLIAKLMFKCGFFRRKKKEELYALRTEQEICETFGYPPESQYEECQGELSHNYEYAEIYDYAHGPEFTSESKQPIRK